MSMSDPHQYSKDEIAKKIGKLIRKLEGARAIGSEAEAMSLEESLSRLMQRYSLTMDDVQFEEHRTKEEIAEQAIIWEKFGLDRKYRRCDWIELLADCVCDAYGCRFLVHKGSNRITFVGREIPRSIACAALGSLVKFATKESERAARAHARERAAEGRRPAHRFAASWRYGFVDGIRAQIEARSLQAGSASQACTALCRIAKEKSDASEHIDAMGIGSAEQLASADASGAGFCDGYASGLVTEYNPGGEAIGDSEKSP